MRHDAPVLVTGATGFVGAAVARALLAADYRVRVLVRSTSRLDNLAGLDVDRVTGDVCKPDTLVPAVRGCRGVFHVAADYRLWTPDPAPMYASNVDGSRHVIEAAAQAGVERVVYTSSVATLAPRADGSLADEEDVGQLDAMIGHYKRSKFLAEQAVAERAHELDLDVIIVHPSTPVGPGDIKPTPTGRIVQDAMHGRMPFYVDTGLDIVHVDDVGEGHRLAFERGHPGRHYILGGEGMSLRDILACVAGLEDRHGPWLQVPHAVTLPMAWLAETGARITGKTPLITLAGVRLARKHMYFSHDRAARELGYTARPACDALAAAVAWFRQHGTT